MRSYAAVASKISALEADVARLRREFDYRRTSDLPADLLVAMNEDIDRAIVQLNALRWVIGTRRSL